MGLLAKGLLILSSAIMSMNDAPICIDDTERFEPVIRSSVEYSPECLPEHQVSRSCYDADVRLADMYVVINTSDFMLRVRGIREDGSECTFVEQRVIMGKEDWETPLGEFNIPYAHINPFWYPPKKILKELAEEHSEEYVQRTFYHDDGTYMAPGKNSPLGKVKMYVRNGRGIKIHGTPYKRLFKYRYRAFSHGCVRSEDEVELLRIFESVVGIAYCDADCLERKLASDRTRYVEFNRPIKLFIE